MRLLRRLATKLSITTPFIMTLMMSITSVCFGESEPGKNFPDSDVPEMGAVDSLQMVGKVIFFLILIIGLFFVVIKMLARKNQYSIFGRAVRTLGGVPLGQNKSIQIVEIGNSLYVVGVGDNIQLLEKIDHPDEVAQITELFTTNQSLNPSLSSFGKGLSKLLYRKKEEEDVELTSSFQQVFHNKLQQRAADRSKRVEDWLMDEKNIDRSNDK